MDAIGKMRERIRIATLNSLRDPKFGGEQKVFELSSPIWAAVEVKTIGTDETYTANQKTASEKVLFTIRFREVAYTSEIEYRGERYRIEGVAADARRTYLTIETKRLGNE